MAINHQPKLLKSLECAIECFTCRRREMSEEETAQEFTGKLAEKGWTVIDKIPRCPKCTFDFQVSDLTIQVKGMRERYERETTERAG